MIDAGARRPPRLTSLKRSENVKPGSSCAGARDSERTTSTAAGLDAAVPGAAATAHATATNTTTPARRLRSRTRPPRNRPASRARPTRYRSPPRHRWPLPRAYTLRRETTRRLPTPPTTTAAPRSSRLRPNSVHRRVVATRENPTVAALARSRGCRSRSHCCADARRDAHPLTRRP